MKKSFIQHLIELYCYLLGHDHSGMHRWTTPKGITVADCRRCLNSGIPVKPKPDAMDDLDTKT